MVQLTEPSADLTLAIALISAITDRIVPDELMAFGEIGLSGEIRAVSHADVRVKEAVRLGFRTILLPEKNMTGSLRVPEGVRVVGVTHIVDALTYLRGKA